MMGAVLTKLTFFVLFLSVACVFLFLCQSIISFSLPAAPSIWNCHFASRSLAISAFTLQMIGSLLNWEQPQPTSSEDSLYKTLIRGQENMQRINTAYQLLHICIALDLGPKLSSWDFQATIMSSCLAQPLTIRQFSTSLHQNRAPWNIIITCLKRNTSFSWTCAFFFLQGPSSYP